MFLVFHQLGFLKSSYEPSVLDTDTIAAIKNPQIINPLRKKKDQVNTKFIQGCHISSTRCKVNFLTLKCKLLNKLTID